jgi:hypothetical protein
VAARLTEPRSQDLTLILQNISLAVAELLEQLRRAFDVREQKGDRPAG